MMVKLISRDIDEPIPKSPFYFMGAVFVLFFCAICGSVYSSKRFTSVWDGLEDIMDEENERLQPLGLEWTVGTSGMWLTLVLQYKKVNNGNGFGTFGPNLGGNLFQQSGWIQ